MEQKHIVSEFFVEQPKHQSINEIRDEKKKEDRIKCGLTDHFIDIKDASKDPSLAYVGNPPINSKSELNLRRRQDNFEEFKKTEAI